MVDNPAAASGQLRAIRVFISSTFRDMHWERDESVKQIFPQLRRLCDQRGVVWNEVDLRWGVTDEQKAEGRVLPICLAEIYNCRPYFLGLLGEGYGWVPDDIAPELLEQRPCLQEHRDRSVTELEILHRWGTRHIRGRRRHDPGVANRHRSYRRQVSRKRPCRVSRWFPRFFP